MNSHEAEIERLKMKFEAFEDSCNTMARAVVTYCIMFIWFLMAFTLLTLPYFNIYNLINFGFVTFQLAFFTYWLIDINKWYKLNKIS